jgi:Concanavalin A-like lectin/glucanases superfamily
MKTLCCAVGLALVVFAGRGARCDWNSTITASNPFNWYRFNELSGNTAVDYGSEHRNGSYGNGALDATRGVDGLVGVAAQFGDQSTVFLSAPDIIGDWSAEFVLMRTGSKRSSVLIRGIPFAFPSGALKLEQFDNTHQVGYTKFGIVDATFSPPVTSPIDEWIHLVYVNSVANDRIALYVNGDLAATRTDHLSLSRDQIGSWSDTIPESPLAIMDEVILYNRALAAGEIAAHFASIPEPSSLMLFELSLFGIGCLMRPGYRAARLSVYNRGAR